MKLDLIIKPRIYWMPKECCYVLFFSTHVPFSSSLLLRKKKIREILFTLGEIKEALTEGNIRKSVQASHLIPTLPSNEFWWVVLSLWIDAYRQQEAYTKRSYSNEMQVSPIKIAELNGWKCREERIWLITCNHPMTMIKKI